MEQKTIWKAFLIIGINLLFFITISCDERIEELHTVSYVYNNNSGLDLVLEVYNKDNVMFKSFNILNNGNVETNTSEGEVPAVRLLPNFLQGDLLHFYNAIVPYSNERHVLIHE